MAPSYASGRRTVRPVAHQILVAIASATMVSFAASATATLRSAAWVAPRKNRPALTCAPCGLGKPLLYEGGSIEKDGASDISIPQPMSRRLPLVGAAALLACACGFCSRIAPAKAETQLVVPPADKLQQYDQPRDKQRDAGFAQGMATGMADYEQAVSKKKRPLFDRLLKALPRKDATIVEVGMGSFPNAAYFSAKNTPEQMDIIGVDPNDSMEKFARESAKKAGILNPKKQNNLRVVHGVAEALPLPSGSADAVICTLTLCSVLDPQLAVAEIKRVLKPGGQFLFHEHVISEEDDGLAQQQIGWTPYQMARADGCRLDRRTLETIKAGGFSSVDGEYYELKDFQFLNPTVCGIATV
eukprot:TRINITY_DN39541_c0_g1_i2.p1 TRINITY_DN39541_c0_g1~~TRINITY_DN39541_c0_g1_i2.p1  ORF type:complete len:357 (-),score=79.27 TRINITY_DN39541_c0_g1_i2:53-1123(-)